MGTENVIKTCKWRWVYKDEPDNEDYRSEWITSCGDWVRFTELNNPCDGFDYCCGCGGKIVNMGKWDWERHGYPAKGWLSL